MHRFWCFASVAIVFSALSAESLIAQQVDAASSQREPQKYALLIGVNSYLGLRGLEFASADQWALAERLEGAGFPKDQITVLTSLTKSGDKNDDVKSLPYQRTILSWLRNVTGMTRDGDLLVIAFSGHGIQIEDRNYLCPVDADPESPQDTMISVELLNDRLKSADAKLKLLVLDACRDDPRPVGRRSGAANVNFDYGLPPDGVVSIRSCSRGMIAYEDKELGHGVFMHYFLQGLDGKAAGEDGTVTLGRLFEYASRETDKYTARKFNSIQKPVMVPDRVEELTPIRSIERRVLARSPERRPVVTSVPSRPEMPREAPLKPAELVPGQVRTNSIGMELVTIPVGEFLMGSPQTEAGRDNDEQQHRVRITKPFELGVYEVTQEEYQKVMDTNPSLYSSSGEHRDDVRVLDTRRFPVEGVSWDDAVEFCRRLSKQEGRVYRLPTEAEWEYACRAGTTTEYYTGNGERALAEAGWYGAYSSPVGNSPKRTNLVGQRKPNAFGLYDMHGNVWEWCSDWYDASYYANSPPADPSGPANGSYRVLRGGGWYSFPVYCRSAYRGRDDPSTRNNYLGFRLASVPSE